METDLSEDSDEIKLNSLAEIKIAKGHQLIFDLNQLDPISGTKRLQKRITAEINFLQKAVDSKTLKIENILCSNLIHFEFLIRVLKRAQNVQSVDFPVKTGEDQDIKLRIDIIADDGATWIKVIARNSKAINDIALGRSNYGARSVRDHAISYIEAAKQNQHSFQIPRIVFYFAHQIDDELEESLRSLNVELRFNTACEMVSSPQPNIKTLNLDVTTMMAYISALTCESYDWEFDQQILNEQAMRESLSSTKEFLDKQFEGKELIACETAIKSFQQILNIVGGQSEKMRAEDFLKRISVYPDLTEDEEESIWQGRRLQIIGKIRDRTFKIITFGLFHKALTVTANKGALEAAKVQGFSIPAIIHEARALTEQKQLTAKYVRRKC